MSIDTIAAWKWELRYGDDERFYELADQLRGVGLHARVGVEES